MAVLARSSLVDSRTDAPASQDGRRNAYLHPDALAAHFGPRAQVVFDSSCQRWYVARQDSALRAAGFRTWDVNERGAFVYNLPGAP